MLKKNLIPAKPKFINFMYNEDVAALPCKKVYVVEEHCEHKQVSVFRKLMTLNFS